jgi:photosystem II stability/assembly factor-like uncharacterized protein
LNSGLTDTAISIWSLAIDPFTPSTVYAGTVPGIFKSTDDGLSWSLGNVGFNGGRVREVVIDPVHPSTIYALSTIYDVGPFGSGPSHGGVFKSTNGGLNWTGAHTCTTCGLFFDLAIDSANTAILYHGGTSLFKSANAGMTWTQTDIGNNGFVTNVAVDPINPANVYAIDRNDLTGEPSNLFKSIDRGATWTIVTHDLPRMLTGSLAINPFNPSTLYAIGNGNLYKSTDGGKTWTGLIDYAFRPG